MSVDVSVICRRSAPTDLERFVGSRALPFAFRIVEYAQWRDDTLEWLGEQEGPGEFEVELARRLEQPWSFVASLNCRPAAAEVTDLCARELVARLGGFFYDDHGAQLSEIVEGSGATSGHEIVEAWLRLVHDAEEAERRIAEHARTEHEAARARDPASFAEADDWSDV